MQSTRTSNDGGVMPSLHTYICVHVKNSVAYDGARQGWFAQGFNIMVWPPPAVFTGTPPPPPNEMFNTLFKHLEKEIKECGLH